MFISKDYTKLKKCENNDEVLDFTPNYMSNAYVTINNIKNIYTKEKINNLTFIYVTRNPTNRAFSEYCSFHLVSKTFVNKLANFV